jgi:hypothetical protein
MKALFVAAPRTADDPDGQRGPAAPPRRARGVYVPFKQELSDGRFHAVIYVDREAEGETAAR